MDQLSIRMFGGFHLYVNSEAQDTALSRSPKGQQLMQLLLLRSGETIPAAELINLLHLATPIALKTLVSRTRSLLSGIHPVLAECIATGSGGYYWKESLPVDVDLLRFQRVAEKICTCHELTEETRAQFEEAIALYDGDLLGYTTGSELLAAKIAAMQTLYLSLVLRYLNLLEEADELDNMIRVCSTAANLLPFNEMLHLRMAEIMLRAGQSDTKKDALHYQRQVIDTSRTLDDSVAQLQRELGRMARNHAFICDRSVLKDVAGLMLRMLDRSNRKLYLGLIMLSTTSAAPLHPLHVDTLVEGLLRHLSQNLRRSDVVCRTGDTQVAVLLSTPSDEITRMILERITVNYLRQDNELDSSCFLSYRLIELE